MEALNALSFNFKRINDNLNNFSNPSSSDIYCIPMDIDLESFNCRKIIEESKATFSKSFQTEFQNEFSTLFDESLEFQNSRVFIFQAKYFEYFWRS